MCHFIPAADRAKKGEKRGLIKTALNRYWAKHAPNDILFATETTFRLNEDSFVEPDFVFYRRSNGLAGLNPTTALLAVEVADASLSYDLGRKAKIYAGVGVRALWVVNATRLVTTIHRCPTEQGYTDKTDVPPTSELRPDFADELTVVLNTLELI